MGGPRGSGTTNRQSLPVAECRVSEQRVGAGLLDMKLQELNGELEMKRAAGVEEVREGLRRLEGRWRGFGVGSFPTIEAFQYREVLDFLSRDPLELALSYHQQSWLVVDGEDAGHSHWESGFVMGDTSGQIELFNAQESRRVEVLVGSIAFADDGACTLDLRSTLQGHDQRMRHSRRTLRFDENHLSYKLEMETDRVSPLTPHLEAKLTKER